MKSTSASACSTCSSVRVAARAAIVALCAAMAFSGSSLAAAAPTASPPLVPWPKSLHSGDGFLALAGKSRIVYAAASLAPSAKILSDEIWMLAAVRLSATSEAARPGDIELKLDSQLQGEAYAIEVGDRAVVRGGNYRAVAWGTVTLLQALDTAGGTVRLPRIAIGDSPAAPYRGLMIDVARQWHRIEDLRPIVEMCRLYKINYLQLHLNDQQLFTFPSKAFPQLATVKKGERRTYTREEITGLVSYADQRGVTIVPEMEGPGHHSGALRSIWGRKGSSCMDMGNEKTYEGMDVLVGELCEVFASSPYIHIGADECSLGGIGESQEEKAFMAQHGIENRGGLYNYYIVRMNEIIKRHGKKTICWEGFHGDGGGGVKIPKDIIVMPFESTYNPANKLVKLGYTVINTAWKPLYVVNARHWPAEYVYDHWNFRLWEHHINTRCHIQLAPSDPVLGAQMCAWEQTADRELPSTRVRLHAMGERTWNPDAGRTYADFAARAERTDRLLDRVLGMIDVHAEGLSGKRYRDFEYFWDPITVRMSAPPVGAIHYTLDGKTPTAQSPRYAGPFTLGKDDTHFEKLFYNHRKGRHEATGNVVRVKAQLFDSSGAPVGDVVTLRQYWHEAPAEQKPDDAEK